MDSIQNQNYVKLLEALMSLSDEMEGNGKKIPAIKFYHDYTLGFKLHRVRTCFENIENGGYEPVWIDGTQGKIYGAADGNLHLALGTGGLSGLHQPFYWELIKKIDFPLIISDGGDDILQVCLKK